MGLKWTDWLMLEVNFNPQVEKRVRERHTKPAQTLWDSRVKVNQSHKRDWIPSIRDWQGDKWRLLFHSVNFDEPFSPLRLSYTLFRFFFAVLGLCGLNFNQFPEGQRLRLVLNEAILEYDCDRCPHLWERRPKGKTLSASFTSRLK